VNLRIILESLKFYKMKSERTIQVWFIVLYCLNLSIYLLPFVDTDFSGYFAYLDSMLSGRMPADSFFSILTTGNLFFLGLSFLLTLIGAFFFIMYATLFVGQNDGMEPRDSFKKCVSALPRFLLLLLLLALLSAVSACLAFLPLLVLAVVLYFLPLNLTLENRPLRVALEKSFRDSRQVRFFIFLKVILLSLLLSLPRGLILSFIPDLVLPYVMVATFFTVLQLFAQARLMGILYLLLVKKEPGVLPSKPEK
jgi:hypothetical protein